MKLSVLGKQENLMDTLETIFSFDELHEKLVQKTGDFFQAATNAEEENSTIFLIKDYISQKYMNETLSVKDISDHVFLSTSYVCTFFKNETGQTLNQYLTEFRMEKAKQLLAVPDTKLLTFLPESATVMVIISEKVLRNIQVFLHRNTGKRKADRLKECDLFCRH